jgi:hypothetical protein
MEIEPSTKNKTSHDEMEYKIGKYVYIVSPRYDENDGKNIIEMILNLMIKDTEKS